MLGNSRLFSGSFLCLFLLRGIEYILIEHFLRIENSIGILTSVREHIVLYYFMEKFMFRTGMRFFKMSVNNGATNRSLCSNNNLLELLQASIACRYGFNRGGAVSVTEVDGKIMIKFDSLRKIPDIYRIAGDMTANTGEKIQISCGEKTCFHGDTLYQGCLVLKSTNLLFVIRGIVNTIPTDPKETECLQGPSELRSIKP